MLLSLLTRNRIFWIVSILHIITILSLLLITILGKGDYNYILLEDDGYYDIAKGILQGRSPINNDVGLGLPLIYTIIHLFPTYLHPFIQLLLSIIASLGVIAISLKIAGKYLSKTESLIGALIFIFNPVYFHWTFKNRPEIYLALLFGIFIYCLIEYSKSKRIKWLIYAFIAFAISIFIKPTFLFIPLFIFFWSIFSKKKHVIIASALLLISSFLLYALYDGITGNKSKNGTRKLVHTYGKTHLIYDTYWTNYVIKTRQFRKQSIKRYENPPNFKKFFNAKEAENYNLSYPFGAQWIKEYCNKNPNANYFEMNLSFIQDKPGLFLQKFLLSPFFFLGMSAREGETFCKLGYSLIAIIISVIGIKKLLRLNREFRHDILIIIYCIFGYASLHFVLHAMNRYSLPILPYLTIWSGKYIGNLLKDKQKKLLKKIIK